MDCVVAPLDQRMFEATDEVRVTLPPVQNVVGPLAEIVGAALTVTTTGMEALEVHPLVVWVTV
jgi:hypothetical protein